jgi:hypothetical protein
MTFIDIGRNKNVIIVQYIDVLHPTPNDVVSVYVSDVGCMIIQMVHKSTFQCMEPLNRTWKKIINVLYCRRRKEIQLVIPEEHVWLHHHDVSAI